MALVGPWEIALVLAIVLILFGPKKLPELAKSLGNAIRQYRQAPEGVLPSAVSQSTQSVQPVQYKARETDLLIETAKKLGIHTEAKTMEQILKEIRERASEPSKKVS
jgi:sec-independent protein translocase protein TatA